MINEKRPLFRNLVILFVVLFFAMLVALAYKEFFKEKYCKMSLDQIYEQDNIVPIVILGSGPAGLSAGIYSSRLGFKTLIIDGYKPGGQLTETSYVENWPGETKILGKDLIEKLKNHNINLGVTFLQDNVVNINFDKWPYSLTTSDGTKINALSIIIATGSSPRTLNVLGEKEYWAKGITTCAVCDAPFYKDKKVIVVGGGDSAAEQVLQLAPHVSHITMLVRKESLKATKAMQDRIKEIKNLTILYNKEIQKITGNSEFVTAAEILDNKNNSTETMNIDGIFLAIGHTPNTSLFKSKIQTDKAGYIKLEGRSQKTSRPGVFAAGDVEDFVYMQAGIASGNGIKAALDSSAFLHNIGFNAEEAKRIKNNYFEPTQDVSASKVLTITSIKELEKLISKNKTVVVDFWAKYCPTCIHMLPTFESLSKKYADKITFVKINIEEAKDIAEKLYILKVPTFIIYKNGQIAARYHDFMDKPKMIKLIEKFMN